MAKSPPLQHIPNSLLSLDPLLTQAAEQYGTPLYFYSKAQLEQNWRTLRRHLPPSMALHYSVKANPNIALLQTLAALGANFEVASVGELLAVLYVGVQPARIIFVGPGKSDAELEFAVAQGLNAIVAESAGEVERLRTHACNQGRRPRVALRINPGSGRGVLTMGGTTQFGMEADTARSILQAATAADPLDFVGIHSYLGTQLLDWRAIYEHTQLILQVSAELQQQTGRVFTFVDIGGGFGLPFYEVDQPLDLAALQRALNELFAQYAENHPTTTIFAAESGRHIVGSCGVFLTKVVDVKNYCEQQFVILDGGINVFGGNDRYIGSRPIPIRLLRSPQDEPTTLTLCGPLCTPLDRLAANIVLPPPRPGDLVAFYLAGAYGYTASAGLFLSHGFPCEVFNDGEQLSLVRDRTTPCDVLAHQHLPGEAQ